MTHETSGTPDYTMGFSEEMLESLRRFTAQDNAAYLLPYLRPGLRILDFGCGPGTISAGLAKAVAPGELHGVDMEERRRPWRSQWHHIADGPGEVSRRVAGTGQRYISRCRCDRDAL